MEDYKNKKYTVIYLLNNLNTEIVSKFLVKECLIEKYIMFLF